MSNDVSEDDGAYQCALKCALLFDSKHAPRDNPVVMPKRNSLTTVERRRSRIMSHFGSWNSRIRGSEKPDTAKQRLWENLKTNIQRRITNTLVPATPASPSLPAASRPVTKRPTVALDLTKNCLVKFLNELGDDSFAVMGGEDISMSDCISYALRLYVDNVKQIYRDHWQTTQGKVAKPAPDRAPSTSLSDLTPKSDEATPPDSTVAAPPDGGVESSCSSYINDQLSRELSGFISMIRMAAIQADLNEKAKEEVEQRLQNVHTMNFFDLPDSYRAKASQNVGPLASLVMRLFKIDPSDHTYFVQKYSPLCTEENASQDIHFLLDMLIQGTVYGLPKSVFYSDEDYLAYMNQENRELSELYENIRYSSFSYNTFRRTEFDKGGQRGNLIFMPQTVLMYYHETLGRCLFQDICKRYETSSPPEDTCDLSEGSKFLLQECTKFWRIRPHTGQVLRFEVLTRMALSQDIPYIYLLNALDEVEREFTSQKHIWTTLDVTFCHHVFTQIIGWSMLRISETVQQVENTSEALVTLATKLLHRIVNTAIFQKVMASEMESIEASAIHDIQYAANQRFRYLHHQAQENYGESDLTILSFLADRIDQDVTHLERHLAQVHLSPNGAINLATVVLDIQLKGLKLDVQNITRESSVSPEYLSEALDIYDFLYQLDGKLASITGSSVLHDDLPQWLNQYLRAWMTNMEVTIPQWIESAIQTETRETSTEQFPYSSSVIDLMTIFSQQIAVIKRIRWPDLEIESELLVRFVKILYAMIDRYRQNVEEQFMATIALGNLGNAPSFSGRSSQLLRHIGIMSAPTDDVQPVYFSLDSCVAFNTMYMLTEKVDDMYVELGIQDLLQRLEEADRHSRGPRSDLSEPHTHYLVGVDVLHANAISLDKSNPKPFVTLTNKNIEQEMARSRPSFLGTNPRWDEYIEFTVTQNTTDLLLAIKDVDDFGQEEETYAVVRFQLDVAKIGVEVTHNFKLKLIPEGELSIRLTVDQAKENVQFYFGKACRTLQMAQNSMRRMIVQQMSPYLRKCLEFKQLFKVLSEPVTRHKDSSLSPPNQFFTFLRGRSSGNRTTAPSNSSHQEGQDKALKRSKSVVYDPEMCDQALLPLTDYLNTNLSVLFQNLHSGVSKSIVESIWREILLVVDDLLLPPAFGYYDKKEYTILSSSKLRLVYDCLERLKLFFNGDGATGIDLLERLESRHFFELLRIQEYYQLTTNELVDRYIAVKELSYLPEESRRRHAVQRRKSVWTYGNRQRRQRLHRDSKKATNDIEILTRLLILRGEMDMAEDLSRDSGKVNLHPRGLLTFLNSLSLSSNNQTSDSPQPPLPNAPLVLISPAVTPLPGQHQLASSGAAGSYRTLPDASTHPVGTKTVGPYQSLAMSPQSSNSGSPHSYYGGQGFPPQHPGRGIQDTTFFRAPGGHPQGSESNLLSLVRLQSHPASLSQSSLPLRGNLPSPQSPPPHQGNTYPDRSAEGY
ncbi:hypothetical protein IWQ61_008840 [Dispira simplex]|nr:hypothetical protein IWQ61_008840 [Dispira simplex]